MGFVGKALENVQGIQWFYTLGILIFIALFIVIVIRTIRMPKKDLEYIKTSILDQEEMESNSKLTNQNS